MVEHQKSYYQKLVKQLLEANPFYNSTDVVYHVLLHEILCGNFVPGDRIMQANMAEMLSVSRTPVRDAVDRLLEEKFLKSTEKGGAQVMPIQLTDYVAFSQFREALETKAAYYAARNCTLEQIERMEKNLEQTEKVLTEKDMYQLISLDMEFHDIILEACGNDYIKEALGRYRNKEIYFLSMIMRSNSAHNTLNKHRAIYEAIRLSDEETAQSQMKSHLSFYLRHYIKSHEI